MTKEDVTALLYIRLSKPPYLEELIGLVLEGLELDVSRLQSTPYSRLELAKAIGATTLQELDESLREILLREVGEVSGILPGDYRGVVGDLLVLQDLESALVDPGRLPSQYDFARACGEGDLNCLIKRYVEKLRSSMEATGEEASGPLSVVALALYGIFVRYALSWKKLGIKQVWDTEAAFNELVRPLGGAGLVYYAGALSRFTSIASLWERDPAKYLAEEAKIVNETSKTALYFPGGLLNLLTHFLITRYYESKLLRVLVSRRILRVG
ncbi:hypothetical protein TCELL_1132 [Thermogladius calderae 1633]|uniref:Uncharacterized protein n=1 Tax=Thermogladius calderae (strain DSM 22663 / VKM B-2946 / 1633) TaxID=1184251 RepID=I3TFL7_THEC1|nr:hypothetical protein [Thermogladius calderae]AFK51555.1 hypothetical protein TCELL_1132 [Thermogladius calderae 1633]